MNEASLHESNLLTPSRLKTYRECPRKHYISYVLGYRPVVTSDAFRFGTLWHDVYEKGLLAVSELQPGDERAYDLFLRAATDSVPRDTDAYEAAKVRALLRGVTAVLRERQFFHHHEILAVEKPFMFPHVNPATGRPSPLWQRAGKIDAILRHRASGRIRVMEHKTTDDPIEIDAVYWQNLSLDTQISQYVLGVEVMHPDITVDEVVYDVVRKTGFRPLRATPPESRKFTQAKFKQCPECKKKGGYLTAPHTIDGVKCEFDPEKADPHNGAYIGPNRLCTDRGGALYAGQRLDDETPQEYEKRVWEEDVLPNLHGHYAVQVIPRTEGQIEAHLRETWAWSQAMREDRSMGFAPMNPDACHRFGTCPFFDVCTNRVSLEDTNRYERLDNVHPELGEFVEEARKARAG